MTELCFAEFVTCLQRTMLPTKNNQTIVRLLLGWIDTHNKNKGFIDPKLVSQLINRQEDVPYSFRRECGTKSAIKSAIEYCQENILPYLNASLSDDMFFSMSRAIDNDKEMGPTKKTSLLEAYKTGREADFLGELLMYVINISNKAVDSAADTNDIALLAEAHYRCPICNHHLVENTLNGPISRYEIIDIFRDDIQGTPTEIALIDKPLSLECQSNKIALCRDHAAAYTKYPTVEFYLNLRKRKDRLALEYKQIAEADAIKLEDEIKDIVEKLLKLKDSEPLEELSLTPLNIDSKIAPNNFLLRNDVKHRVILYYKYINDLFFQLERSKNCDYSTIAAEVKLAYKKLAKSNLNPEAIEQHLAEWINRHSGNQEERMCACHIIVAFFIQKCEVFDATAQQGYLIQG